MFIYRRTKHLTRLISHCNYIWLLGSVVKAHIYVGYIILKSNKKIVGSTPKVYYIFLNYATNFENVEGAYCFGLVRH